MFRMIFSLIAFFCISACASVPATEPADVAKLIDMLTGEFDSGIQARADRLAGKEGGEAHGWVNRVFVKVDAPEAGKFVMVASTRYQGPPWVFDENEYFVWTFEPSSDGSEITMSPRRFKAPEDRIPLAKNAAALAGFTAADLEPAISGAACNIVWRASGQGFEGRSTPCHVRSVVSNQMLHWDWRFAVDRDALWIEFSGRKDDGSVLDGTPSEPYRLDRVEGGAEYWMGRHTLLDARNRTELADATTLLELAVQEVPNNGSAYVALIYSLTKANAFDRATQLLPGADALEHTLSHSDRLWYRALKQRLADDNVMEIAAWRAVVEAIPDDRWAWYELGVALYRGQQFSEAVTAIEAALGVEPEETRWGASYIYYLHSKSLFRSGDYANAIVAADPGIRNAATRRATFYRRAMAETAAANSSIATDNALATYRQYSMRDGQVNEANLQTNIALFYFELGNYHEAVRYARAGHALSDGAYQSWALGYSLTEQGNPTVGLVVLDSALEAHPNNVYLLAGKGWAHYRLGQLQEAESSLLAAREVASRKNSGVERDLRTVQQALAEPSVAQVPPVRWFGD